MIVSDEPSSIRGVGGVGISMPTGASRGCRAVLRTAAFVPGA